LLFGNVLNSDLLLNLSENLTLLNPPAFGW